jgi:glycosyltransferase involved in cell wall biosynthesis
LRPRRPVAVVLKILFVSWFFPPSNTIAAVRLGKLARHLCARGHDLRILTAEDPPYPQTLPSEIDDKLVLPVRWRDINWFPLWAKDRVMSLLPRRQQGAAAPPASQSEGPPEAGSGGPPQGLRKKLALVYALTLNFPDKWVGWLPAARQRGVAVAREWRPDGIFASGPPFTTLLIGYLISRAVGVPLVVEFRDRWSEDPYYPPPPWRQRWNRWLEERIVRHAAGLTTVSEPWAARFRERFAKPVAVIYNGFDSEDFAALGPIDRQGGGPLRIVYTGGIYPGYRDPSPLFRAIATSARLREQVRVEFYGTRPDLVTRLAQEHGVVESVRVFGHVTHAEALKVQCQADALLLMQWDNPREQGNIPGKFAEYLGARRPLVVLGYAEGVPASFVRERAAGIASTDPARLAQELEAWLDEKEMKGHLPALGESVVAEFSRSEQAAKLEAFLRSVLAGDGGADRPGGQAR